MKRWNILFITISSLVASVGFLLFAVSPDSLSAPFHMLKGMGGFARLVALALSVWGIWAFSRFVKSHWTEMSSKTLSLTTDEGVSAIGLEAVEDLVRNRLNTEKDLSDVSVILAVMKDGKTVDCRIHFNICNQPDLPGRLDAHKRTVRDLFKSLIPGEVTLSIVCVVDEILVEAPDKKGGAAEPGRRPSGVMSRSEFNGPVYPLPQEGQTEEPDEGGMR